MPLDLGLEFGSAAVEVGVERLTVGLELRVRPADLLLLAGQFVAPVLALLEEPLAERREFVPHAGEFPLLGVEVGLVDAADAERRPLPF